MLTCSYDSVHITLRWPLLSCPLPLPCIFLFLGSLVLDSNAEAEILLLAFLWWVSSPALGTQVTSKQRAWKEGGEWAHERCFLACILGIGQHPNPCGAEKSLRLLRETQSTCHTSAQCTSLSVLGFFSPLDLLYSFRFSFCQFEWEEEEGRCGWHCQEDLPLALIESYLEARQAHSFLSFFKYRVMCFYLFVLEASEGQSFFAGSSWGQSKERFKTNQ